MKARLRSNHVLNKPAPPPGYPWTRREWRLLQAAAADELKCSLCGKYAGGGALLKMPITGLVALCPEHLQSWDAYLSRA